MNEHKFNLLRTELENPPKYHCIIGNVDVEEAIRNRNEHKFENEFRFAMCKMEYEGKLYVTDGFSHPTCSKETLFSFILRKLGLKKTITYGKPKKMSFPSQNLFDYESRG